MNKLIISFNHSSYKGIVENVPFWFIDAFQELHQALAMVNGGLFAMSAVLILVLFFRR